MLKTLMFMLNDGSGGGGSGSGEDFYIQCVEDSNFQIQTDSNLLYRLNNDPEYQQLGGGYVSRSLYTGQKMYIYNPNNELLNTKFTLNGGVVDLGGNINSLINYSQVYQQCFKQLFKYCTAIRYTNQLDFPSKTLADSCYQQMFAYCNNMYNSPNIEAVNMAYYSCKSMFQYCSNLIYAPCLRATETVSYCYSGMFRSCYNLQQIQVKFTEWRGDTSNWVSGVSNGNGVFVCPAELEVLYDDNHIPSGWEVYNPPA